MVADANHFFPPRFSCIFLAMFFLFLFASALGSDMLGDFEDGFFDLTGGEFSFDDEIRDGFDGGDFADELFSNGFDSFWGEIEISDEIHKGFDGPEFEISDEIPKIPKNPNGGFEVANEIQNKIDIFWGEFDGGIDEDFNPVPKRGRKRALEANVADGPTATVDSLDPLLVLLARNPTASAKILRRMALEEGLGYTQNQVNNFQAVMHRRARIPTCVHELLITQFETFGATLRPDSVALARACRTPQNSLSVEDLERWVSLVIAKGVTPAFASPNQVEMGPSEFQAFLVDIATRRGVAVAQSVAAFEEFLPRPNSAQIADITTALLLLIQGSPEATASQLHAAMKANGWSNVSQLQVKNFRANTHRRARMPVRTFRQLQAGFAKFGLAYRPSVNNLVSPLHAPNRQHAESDLRNWVEIVIATREESLVSLKGLNVVMTRSQFQRMVDLLVAQRRIMRGHPADELDVSVGHQADEFEVSVGHQADEFEVSVGHQADELDVSVGHQADKFEVSVGHQADEFEVTGGDQADELEVSVGHQADERGRKHSLRSAHESFDSLLSLMARYPAASGSDLQRMCVGEGFEISKEQAINFRAKMHMRARLSKCLFDLLVLEYQVAGQTFRPDRDALASACKTRIYATNEDLRRWVSLVIAKGVTPELAPGNQVKLKSTEFQAFLVDIANRRGVEVPISSPVPQPHRQRVIRSELSRQTFHALLLLMQESPEATADELHAAMLANGWSEVLEDQVKNFREKTIRRARLPVWAFQQLEAGFAEFGPAYCPKTSDLISPIARGTRSRHSGADLQRWIDVVIATGEEPMVVPSGRDVAMTPPQFKRMLDLLVADRGDPEEDALGAELTLPGRRRSGVIARV